ncbi:hypothetical protein BHE74_00000668 [Ensete ventricosum]|nr:hypothetical protein BHE74_00000668 [Ensete ventricosum]RZR80678.1 hypothetical protein BHM03_00006733 [Ensete ventricosum]
MRKLMPSRGPCALARPRSSQRREGGPQLNDGSFRVWLDREEADSLELRSTANSCKKVGSGGVPDVTSPTVKLVWLLILRSTAPWRCRGFYSKCYKTFVPKVLSVLVAHHAIVFRRSLRGPCSEARVVFPAVGACRPCPLYPEGANLGINLGDLAERVNSGTHLGDLAERTNSGTNLGDLAERVNLGTNLGDLIERVNSVTNLGDLAKRANSGTNLGDLAERANSGTNLGELKHKSWRFRLGDPEASPSGASSEPPSPVDARVLRDLNVMKADHDLNTAVTEGSLAVIRERYNIPAEYGLHVPRSGQRPYSSDTPGVCISTDALEASLRPVCTSSPAIVSTERRWSTVEWWEISGLARQRGSWLFGARVGAFIVKATRRSYLRSLLSPLLTMPSYFVVASVVLAARRASCFLQLGRVDLAHLTRVRSAIRLLTPPYLCQAGSTVSDRPRWRSSYPRA